RVLVFVQHLLPGAATVGRAEDAALVIRTVRMPEYRCKQSVRIARVDNHRRNLLPSAQAKVRPTLASVRRPVYSIADRQIGTVQSFAAGHINNVGIRGSYRNRADRLCRLLIKDWGR